MNSPRLGQTLANMKDSIPTPILELSIFSKIAQHILAMACELSGVHGQIGCTIARVRVNKADDILERRSNFDKRRGDGKLLNKIGVPFDKATVLVEYRKTLLKIRHT